MKKPAIIFILFILLLFQGCAASKETSGNTEIRIAEQYGIAYAPVQIMRHQGLLEEKLPGVKVVWEQMINTAAIREAMVADKLDVGFMAIPPFYIGWDKGMDWKIFTGLSSVPGGLVVPKEIKSLEDITEKDRIALPQPGSVQHILLSMACDREFNNPQKMDNLLVTLSHPDGMNALFSKNEIKAHFTSTPYLESELKNEEFHKILDVKEAFGGDFSFIVGVTTKKFHDQNSELYQALNEGVREAIEFINNNPEKAAKILTQYYDLPQEEILEYLTSEDTHYSTKVKGTKEFSEFMYKTKYISKAYKNPEEILWENVEYEE